MCVLLMYVCVYYVCMYGCVDACLYARMYGCMRVQGCMRVYVCTYVCMYVCMCVEVCVYVCAHVSMYVSTYARTHICTYVCIYVCMETPTMYSWPIQSHVPSVSSYKYISSPPATFEGILNKHICSALNPIPSFVLPLLNLLEHPLSVTARSLFNYKKS
jgi:hypothetical protein